MIINMDEEYIRSPLFKKIVNSRNRGIICYKGNLNIFNEHLLLNPHNDVNFSSNTKYEKYIISNEIKLNIKILSKYPIGINEPPFNKYILNIFYSFDDIKKIGDNIIYNSIKLSYRIDNELLKKINGSLIVKKNDIIGELVLKDEYIHTSNSEKFFNGFETIIKQ